MKWAWITGLLRKKLMKFPFKNSLKQEESLSHHLIFIEHPIEVVSPEVYLWGAAPWWPKKSKLTYSKLSGGDFEVGARLKRALAFPLAPVCEVEVTKFIPNSEMEWTFRTGYIKGIERIVFDERYNGVKVIYEMKYSLLDPFHQILWSLLIESVNDKAMIKVLEALKEHCDQKMKEDI